MPSGRSLVCLPLDSARPSVGVIGLTFEAGWLPGPNEMDFLTAYADTCGQAVRRIQAQPRSSDARAARLTFLAQVSQELGSSLDYRATLTNVANLIVPELADWCAVSIVQDGVASHGRRRARRSGDGALGLGAPGEVPARPGFADRRAERRAHRGERALPGDHRRDARGGRARRGAPAAVARAAPAQRAGRPAVGARAHARRDHPDPHRGLAALRPVRSRVRRGSGTPRRCRDRQRPAVRADPGCRAAAAAGGAARGDGRHPVLGDRHALRAGWTRRGRRRLLRRDRAHRRRPRLRHRRRHGPRRPCRRGDGADALGGARLPLHRSRPGRRGRQARHHVRQARDHPAGNADLWRGRPRGRAG